MSFPSHNKHLFPQTLLEAFSRKKLGSEGYNPTTTLEHIEEIHLSSIEHNSFSKESIVYCTFDKCWELDVYVPHMFKLLQLEGEEQGWKRIEDFRFKNSIVFARKKD